MLEKNLIYIVAALVGVVFAAGWGSHVLYSNSITQAIEKTRALATESAAQAISGITVANNTITGRTVERVRTELIYASCVASPEQLSDFKEAYKK